MVRIQHQKNPQSIRFSKFSRKFNKIVSNYNNFLLFQMISISSCDLIEVLYLGNRLPISVNFSESKFSNLYEICTFYSIFTLYECSTITCYTTEVSYVKTLLGTIGTSIFSRNSISRRFKMQKIQSTIELHILIKIESLNKNYIAK